MDRFETSYYWNFLLFSGQELHLARELESEDYIDVKVDSDEDIFAIKALNLYGHLKNIRQLKVA